MIDIVYLEDYLPGIKVVNNIEEANNKIPSLWIDVLVEPQQEQRKIKLIEIWNSIFRENELSNTIHFMEVYLSEVYLVSVEEEFSLIYVYDVNGNIFYREGKNPKSRIEGQEIIQLLKLFNVDLVSFYEDFHNGWFEPESASMGLLPIEYMKTIGDDDWDILDSIKIEKNLDEVIIVFSNGGNGYLCIDIDNDPITGLIWWGDEAPDFDVTFFDVLDEWIVIGFE